MLPILMMYLYLGPFIILFCFAVAISDRDPGPLGSGLLFGFLYWHLFHVQLGIF